VHVTRPGEAEINVQKALTLMDDSSVEVRRHAPVRTAVYQVKPGPEGTVGRIIASRYRSMRVPETRRRLKFTRRDRRDP